MFEYMQAKVKKVDGHWFVSGQNILSIESEYYGPEYYEEGDDEINNNYFVTVANYKMGHLCGLV